MSRLRLVRGGLGSPDDRSDTRTYGDASPLPGSKGNHVLELTAYGFDEQLQSTGGGDPFGNMMGVGIRVPKLATPNAASRYLFCLATFQVPEGAFARILGYRQYATIGVNSTLGGTGQKWITELPVRTPSWRFVDGNISWHLQRLGPAGGMGFPRYPSKPSIAPSAIYRFADGPALLYESMTLPGTIYPTLSAYTPPNQGRPWGKSLRAGLSTWVDNRSGYTYGDYVPLGELIEGPETIGYFASVYQSNATGRAQPQIPSLDSVLSPNALTGGYADEDAFVVNFPDCIYWRVGGSLLVDMNPDIDD